ncbi:MAG: hypothetical protein ABFD86_15655 [Bryobacteraceae bacterium]
MKRALLLLAVAFILDAQDLPRITIRTTAPAPEWAQWQRRLLREYWPSAQEFVKRYTRPDGTLIFRKHWPGMDGSDDAYESWYNFPLYYALGGDARMDPLSRHLWNKVTELFTGYGTVHDEFDSYYDWMHHGESYVNFYFFGLANPYEPEMRRRALKFAALYMSGPNWDSVHKRIASPITGSKGPRFENTAEDWVTHRPVLANYPLPYDDIPGVTNSKAWVDDKLFPNILATMNKRMMRADVPLNLAATSMIANAYMYTGDPKYRRWIEEYVEAWMKRVEANGGVIPDNIGPNGRIGETMDGKWYGGYYGWRWPHGLFNQLEATMIGGSNAFLVTANPKYLELPRSQQVFMLGKSKVENGRRMVANRHNEKGWYDWRPAVPQYPVTLWYMSFENADWERLLRLVDFDALAKKPYAKSKGDDKNEFPWIRFLRGENPDWPVEILRANWAESQRRLGLVRSDRTDPEDMDVHHWQNRNPLVLEGLVQQMLGGPNHIYHGGLLHGRLRYFDAEKRRAGIPEDVAALVDKITADSVRVTLVNTSSERHHEAILQAGAFGEHQFQSAEIDGKTIRFASKHLRVKLLPGAVGTLTLRMKRYQYAPAYQFPPF